MDLHFSLNGPIGQLSHEFALSVNVCVCLFVPLTFGMFKSANLALWMGKQSLYDEVENMDNVKDLC